MLEDLESMPTQSLQELERHTGSPSGKDSGLTMAERRRTAFREGDRSVAMESGLSAASASV